MALVIRDRAELEVAPETRAGCVTLRNVSVYVVDTLTDILLVGDDVLQLLGISHEHLLEQKDASGDVKDTLPCLGI